MKADRFASSTVVYRTCPLCEATCGLELQVEGDHIVRVRGDKDDVLSNGFLCPKGASLGHIASDGDRLRRPVLREGSRRREVTWAEAFAFVQERLPAIQQDHGRDSVGVYLGNSTAHSLSLQLYCRALLAGLQTKNFFTSATVDQMPRSVVSALLYGDENSVPIPDLDRCDLLCLIGADPMTSNGSLWTVPDFPGRLARFRARGGRLIVIDPRRSRTAQEADLHVEVRPGTDAHLLFAVVNSLASMQAGVSQRLAPHVVGLDTVLDASRAFSPERVSAFCGVDADSIRALAGELLRSPRAAVYGRIGTCTQEFGTLASWLIDVVNLLTGHLDEPGGAVFALPAVVQTNTRGHGPRGRGLRIGRWHSRVDHSPEVLGELPVGCLPDEILTPGLGRVRALITVGANPALSNPNGARVDDALRSLDFMVSIDSYLNETTRHADVVLPPPPLLARSHYDIWSYRFAVRNVARFTAPARSLSTDECSEREVLLRLASIASGTGVGGELADLDEAFHRSMVQMEARVAGSPIEGCDVDDLLAALEGIGEERLLDLLVRLGPHGDQFGRRPGGLTVGGLRRNPHGVDLGPHTSRLPDALRTTSGCVELAPPEIVADLPRLASSLDRPIPDLVLVGRRDLRSSNSWLHNVDKLAVGPERCTLHVHPTDAVQHALEDGRRAVVTVESGAEINVTVDVTERVRAGVVSLPHGWGHDLEDVRLRTAALRPGANYNLLTSGQRRDAVTGTTALTAVPVAVKPA